LLLSALLAGYPLAAFIGLSRAAGSAAWNYGPLAASLLVTALTPVGLAGLLLRGVRATPSIGLAGIVMALACAAIAMRPARSLHDRAGELVHVRTPIAFGASRLHAALLAAKGSVPALLALAVSDLPTLATAAFVTERAFSLRGLGDVTTQALRAGDLTWLMAIALLGTFTLGVAQIAVDVVSEVVDPRREPARARRRRA
jgi:ABC-type dipeptide/oligopeptide/nickel transport system permease component